MKAERGGRTEVEMINHVLAEYQKKDPKLFVDVAMNASGETTLFRINDNVVPY